LGALLAGWFSSTYSFWYLLNLGWLGYVSAALYISLAAKSVQLYDGIDGLASIEAITACCGGALMVWLLRLIQPLGCCRFCWL